jgi:hypothetical protein
MNVCDLAIFRNSKKAFLVVSSRNGDTHLDKMSTQPSCVG